MAETIEVDVGDLYANMHEQYSDELESQYEERLRAQVEDFLHQFNQQVERQQEQAQAGEQIDVEENDIENITEQ